MTLFLTTNLSSENKHPKIVIVGAGIAGLSAAYRLQQNNCDVHVYEAHNRVGGRIFTVKTAGCFAELGGQNISDGGDSENIHRLLKELDLEAVESKISLAHSYFSGDEQIPIDQLLSQRKFNPEKLKAQLEDLAKRSKNMREILNGILEEKDPLYKALAMRLTTYEGGSIDKLSYLYVETLYHMLLGGNASVHQTHGQEEPYINLLSLKNGNAQLPEALGKALGDRLHLNKPLLSVSKDGKGSYLLTFQDGEQVQADILVLAIPCSVYAGIQFEDHIIPEEKLSAIKKVQYGENAKILIPCTKSLQIKAFISDHMVSFFTPNQNFLTLYYIGKSSRFSKETLVQTYNQDRPMIEKEFKDLDPILSTPALARDQSFGSYEGPVGYSWTNDPYIKGSYSYIAAGQEAVLTATHDEQGETVKTLFAPIDQKLYFAGEHASILTEVPGTMEAACESGERAARMILKSAHQ